MRKILSVIVIVFCFCLTLKVSAAPDLSLVINGDTVQSNVSPVLLNNRTLVPARAVFEKLGATVDWSPEQQKVFVSLNNYNVELTLNDTTATVNGNPVSLDVPAQLINDRTMIPARFVAEQLNLKVDWDQQKSIVSINNPRLGDITAAPASNGMLVTINLEYFQNYRTFKLSNPSRIVVDFPNVTAASSQQKMDVNTGVLTQIRYDQFKDANGYSAARVVLDVDSSADYTAEKQGNKLIISLTGSASSNTPSPSPVPSTTPAPTPVPAQTPAPSVNPTSFQNVSYNISGDRVFFKLNNADFTYEIVNQKNKFNDFYENDGKRYIMVYQKALADLGEGTMNINDDLFDSVQFVKDDGTGCSRIIFNCKKKLKFMTYLRYNHDNNNNYIDTVIDVLIPSSPSDKLVVIDPGHGGKEEPGAYSSGIYEKEINLDISKRVYDLLKAKGVKVYITRGDDSYVDLYERAFIANNLNAKLFVCIHNNSYNGSVSGTETLYYSPSSGSSKTVASIIQSKLINALGSRDRGIVSRPGLVVLNSTNMPAVLTEVGFMDNPDELANLMNDAYKQKAAQAICDGIIQSLSQL